MSAAHAQARAPAMQYYPDDHIRDTRALSLEARGAWTDCVAYMWWAPERGRLTHTPEEYARLWGCDSDTARRLLAELIRARICDSVTHRDGRVTLICRRMARAEKARQGHVIRQARYRASRRGDAVLTERSSSSSLLNPPIPPSWGGEGAAVTPGPQTPTTGGLPPDGFAGFWAAYPRQRRRADAERAWAGLHLTPDQEATILAAVDAERHSAQWTRDNGRYIPYPAKWLRERDWEHITPPQARRAMYVRLRDGREMLREAYERDGGDPGQVAAYVTRDI